MKSNIKQYQDLFAGCIARYELDQDIASLKIMYQMIADGKINWKPVDKESVGFLSQAKYNSNCSRCHCEIKHHIDPTFYMGKVGWCVACATPDEKQIKWYQDYLAKKGEVAVSAPTPTVQLKLVANGDSNDEPKFTISDDDSDNYDGRL